MDGSADATPFPGMAVCVRGGGAGSPFYSAVAAGVGVSVPTLLWLLLRSTFPAVSVSILLLLPSSSIRRARIENVGGIKVGELFCTVVRRATVCVGQSVLRRCPHVRGRVWHRAQVSGVGMNREGLCSVVSIAISVLGILGQLAWDVGVSEWEVLDLA